MRKHTGAMAAVLFGLVAGCSATPPAASPTTSDPPIATITPEEYAASGAKEAYITAYLTLVKMGGQPQAKLADYPKEWRITEQVTDPYLTEIVKSLAVLRSEGLAGRDLGIVPRPTVKSVSLKEASSRVVLTWCPSKVDRLYYVATGKDAETTTPQGSAKPPWLITSTMTKIGDKWKLSNVAFDSKSTCKPV